MRYFLLEQDKRILNPIELTLTEDELNSENPISILDKEVGNMVQVDLITKRSLFNTYFFISQSLMRVLSMYDSSISFVPLFIASGNNSFSYFKISLNETENMDRLHKPVHIINKNKQSYLLVNLFVAESILRRYPVGLSFKEWSNEIV